MPRKSRRRSTRGGRRARPAPSPRPTRRVGWRRGLAALSLLAGIGGGAFWLWPGGTPPAVIERTAEQNVLLITIDTLRADALGSYGGAAATPNLDRLARTGTRFEFAHAHAVVTLPSHASILTGTYPFEHGIRDNAGYRLPDDARTVAGMLRAEGFATAAFVAAFPLDSQFGLDSGFDLYDDRFGHAEGPADFTIAERPAETVVAAARAWIEQQPDRWFAWVHLYDPHAVYEPPAPFDQRYATSPYHGEVAYTDYALGPLLETAGAGGQRPTLVIVTADHGEALGDHGELTHGLFAYEATLRVPLILAQLSTGRDTPSDPSGLVLTDPVRHVDIVPSILDALELSVPSGPPGALAARRITRHRAAVLLRSDVGLSQPGLGAAPGCAGRAREIHRPPAARALRLEDRPDRGNQSGRRPRRPIASARGAARRSPVPGGARSAGRGNGGSHATSAFARLPRRRRTRKGGATPPRTTRSGSRTSTAPSIRGWISTSASAHARRSPSIET